MSLSDSLEWGIITALRGYLIFTLPVTNEEFDQLNGDAITVWNARDSFEFELTRVFVRPEPSFDVNFDGFSDLQAALSNFIVLLGALVNVDGKAQVGFGHFGHLFQPLTEGKKANPHYQRLSSLLEHLESSRLMVNLIKGHLGPAFKLPSESTLYDDLQVVRELNHILDTIPVPQLPVEDVLPATNVNNQDARVRDYATTTFRTVFEHLGTCGTPHKLMLYLPSKHGNPPEAFLDLLISVCPDHSEWQEARCGICENLAIRPRTVTESNLCEVIEYSQLENEGLGIHVIGNEIKNLSQVEEGCRHGGDSPSICLRQMIFDGAFKRFDVSNMNLDEQQLRFNPNQKRALAIHIAVALSRLLGSGWVGEGWTTKDLYFLGEKKGDDELPYGPYVSCFSDGPESRDWERLAAKLVKTPHLILFGKLLLEIDLGQDLDEWIDKRLKETPKKNLSTLLLGLYDKAKYELFYGDAIRACLNFHKERKLKREAKDIDVPVTDWCEWDRKYIRDNIVMKLMPPPQRKQLKQLKQPTYHREHPERYKSLSFAYSGSRITSNKARPLLQPSTYQTSSSEYTKPSDSTTFSKSSDQTQYTRATTIGRVDPQPNKELEFSDRPVTDLSVLRRTSIVRESPEMNAWLNDVEHSPDTVQSEARPTIFQTEEDECVLFDDMEDSQPPGEAKYAATYWEELRRFNNKFLPRIRRTSATSTIKIALIDTGVNKSDPLVKGELARISGRSWVDDEPDNYHDICGHGTHLVRLVLQASQTAHIFVSKVSNDKTFGPQNIENIAEAIRWAVKENIHIISLSLGFKSEIPAIKAALEEAINPKKSAGRIVIAAAGNWGYNYPRAFPASQKGVLCVHAVKGNGTDGHFNVKADASNRIATLGVDIPSEWQGKEVWISGTSFAAPIVAAIAANVLEFAQRKLDLDPLRWNQLLSFQGMRIALRLMCMDTDKYAYLAPWSLGKSTDDIAEMIENGLVYGEL
ncbi:peptidase S8/S53 domain-containing protein [Xylaria curta]|nr:peptidase S8/S53 domain-containing protein [Xylaria curta]